MRDFKQNKGKRFGSGHKGGFDRKDRGPVTMHQAVCNQCGKPCEVPFRPTDGKPVYCNVCFRDKRETGNNRRSDRFPQKKFNSYKTPIKTDFGNNISKENNDELKKQLVILNVKMDQLIKAVEAITNTKPLVVEKKVKEVVKTLPIVKVKKLTKRVSKKKKN